MWYDFHCDVLYKLWMNKSLSYQSSDELDINLNRLKRSEARLQTFALFVVEEDVPSPQQFDVVLEMIEQYRRQVLACPEMKPIVSKNDLAQLQTGDIGAFLTLEGCDAIGQSLTRLQTLIQLGVRSVGLTWNFANAVADGVGEPRAAGLTLFGREVVHHLNQEKCWIDVSHLAEPGFWEVMERGDVVWASHCNARALADHPRNLSDEQIKALFQKDGVIGVNFVPDFLRTDQRATINDVLRHIDHMLNLGGEDHVMIGSDFDGIDEKTIGLETYDGMRALKDQFQKHWGKDLVEKLMHRNAHRFMETYLP
ncbi:membrane dipeptidase [Bacillaceae bacterium SIJ1]|uniref:dipeptidase n=1 Tax=Litoribacterium kuwaitense TaxID=1398745 RepID=UPI0013ED0CE2|nr:dipeptidase [Litoribacterium kuwaitense]NGP44061.1 membrane dipeptidase [Litoribacterium kuwaitense]